MPIKELTPRSAAQQQLDSFGKGGPSNQKNMFSLPAESVWAVVGTLVDDAATLSDVPTLESAIRGLGVVVAVEPLHWAQAPATVIINDDLAALDPPQPPSHEVVLHVSATVAQTVAFGGGTGMNGGGKWTPHEPPKPPLGSKFIVWGLKVPASLDQAAIATLTAAITGAHAGFTSTHHLLDGVIDPECVGTASIEIAAHTRIDKIPVEPPE